MAAAIEDAGFDIRDMLAWLYATGFPKSHDLAKAIDKTQLGVVRGKAGAIARSGHSFGVEYRRTEKGDPISFDAQRWDGWGTALKPGLEPIIMARKPFKGCVAANALEHSTGGLNIDATRVPYGSQQEAALVLSSTANRRSADSAGRPLFTGGNSVGNLGDPIGSIATFERKAALGRWPANVLHDGSDDVSTAFPRNAARFFFSAKAGKSDRAGSDHPTVKPVALMRWLCRLVTPPGGTVLDPFAGSGTTGAAALAEGFSAVLMEAEPQFAADIRRRFGLPGNLDEDEFEALIGRAANDLEDKFAALIG